MGNTYIYVVDRDFGFAPNPFHGSCTLATCKPDVRNGAKVGDWVIGVGGKRLAATGRCIFAMRVDEKLTFDDYWSDSRFFDKRPIRNGSNRAMVGDNIYHRDANGKWMQEDSHHSNADGSINMANLNNDTGSNAVLISRHYYYFGINSPEIPAAMLNAIGYRNGIGHRKFTDADTLPIITWIEANYRHALNKVDADPFDFDNSRGRYDHQTKEIS